MLKKLTLLSALLLYCSSAWAIPTCTITGVVNDGAGNPLANGVITFNTLFTQVVSSNTISQTLVSTTTDASGNLTPISLAQGVYVQITINGGAPITAIVPFSTSVTFTSLISSVITNPELTQLVLIGTGTAPSCNPNDATLYFDTVTNRLLLDNNCGGYAPVVTNSSTDTLTNKSLSGDQLTGFPDCQDAGGNHLNYTLSTKTFTCGTTSSGGGGGGSNPQSDATALLFNQADNTKLMKFDLSGITTGTTRTYTTPDVDGAMALTTGTLTSGNFPQFNGSGVLADSGFGFSGSFTSGHYAKWNGTAFVDGLPVTSVPLLAGNSIGSTLPNNAAEYFVLSGFGQASGENSVDLSMPQQGTLSGMICHANSTPTGGSYTFTVRKNNLNTAVTCTIADPATDCSDSTHTASVLTTDRLNYASVPTSTPTARRAQCSLLFTPA